MSPRLQPQSQPPARVLAPQGGRAEGPHVVPGHRPTTCVW